MLIANKLADNRIITYANFSLLGRFRIDCVVSSVAHVSPTEIILQRLCSLTSEHQELVRTRSFENSEITQ